MAAAYAVGLFQSWGIVWSATILIWMAPQFEAERVEKRRRVAPTQPNGASHTGNGHMLTPTANGSLKVTVPRKDKNPQACTAPDEDVANNLAEYEYYWQAYPADAPFLVRLDWAIDLVFAFRGSGTIYLIIFWIFAEVVDTDVGWNWSIPSIPNFAKPEKSQSGELVKLDSIPVSTRFGYTRSTTREAFLRTKLSRLAIDFVILDFCSVFMMKDPYFVLGPNARPLPALLASLHPIIVSIWRSSISLAGIITALHLVFATHQLVCCFLLRRLHGTRSELWHYPSIFGSFEQVLDNGLAGFWGAWWHQTFRQAFAAPTLWLARHGHLGRLGAAQAKAVGSLIAFAQSSALHASGSLTCLPASKPWMPPAFFLLSWVGVLAQAALSAALARNGGSRLPRPLRRAGNLLYVVLWLHLTQWAFVDDLSRSAVWLFEPVPVSPLRAMGLGKPGDGWWRWDLEQWPRLHVDHQHWWKSGVMV